MNIVPFRLMAGRNTLDVAIEVRVLEREFFNAAEKGV